MAPVRFTIHHRFDEPAKDLWGELVDWEAHANWIPATRVAVAPGDPTAVGAEFTAWTGFGKVALEDRMRVTALSWDDELDVGTCTVAKLGPILKGTASFTVRPDGDGSSLEWIEDVTVPYVPSLLAPVIAKLGAGGFKLGMRNLARSMKTTPASSA